MQRSKLWQRLVSLLLAGQLLCVHLPAAFAAETEEPAAPTEIESPVDPSVTPLGGGDPPLLYFYRVGYGANVRHVADVGQFALTDLNDYFAVELAPGTERYGSREYVGATTPTAVDESNTRYTFCVFPGEEDLGRVPDKRFAGWHIIPKDGVKDADPAAWKYAGEDEIRTYPYESGALGFDQFGNLGSAWNMADNTTGADYRAYGYDTAPDFQNPVRMVGRWVDSNLARAADQDGVAFTALKRSGETAPVPELYTEDIAGKPLSALTAEPFAPGTHEYWLRVGADVEQLRLTFNAYEPYYAYNVKGQGACPVAVRGTFNGGSNTYVVDGAALPAPGKRPVTDWNIPRNNGANPAHSRWTTRDAIYLNPSAGMGRRYNDITVTVTSPDGGTTATYTFHVQRLAEPTLERKSGNTPVGMIARDSSGIWEIGGTVAQNKLAARTYFETNYKFHPTLYPQGPENQKGAIFRGLYGPSAWQGSATNNVDKDPNALVVYQDAAFLDPGITLTDAEGNRVDLAGGSVRRTLKLRRAAGALTVGSVGDNAPGEDWYAANEILRKADGSDQIDLRGQKVLPGIYSLEYEYTDPVSKLTYNSAGGGFTNPGEPVDRKISFRRTLVVLPAPGDVDMDGAVTIADAAALRRALPAAEPAGTFNGLSLATNRAAALFAYRVCDLTRSDTLEGADLDKLEAGFAPQLINASGTSDYYYLPLPTGETQSRYQRAKLDVTPSDYKATLSLEFLGKEKGTRPEGTYTVNPQGPDWTEASTDQITWKDTFWLGVKLSDFENERTGVLNQNLTSFTFSLLYDARYLAPAAVLDFSQWNNAGDDLNRWKTGMRIYNIDDAAKAGTIWKGFYDYKLTAASGPKKDRAIPHYSKAITPLEERAAEGSDLKELVFSIQLDPGKPSTNLREGYLLAVPFTLIKYPTGTNAARLVEMQAGMREFAFVGQQGGFGLLGGLDSVSPVAAYSAQDEGIFGGATANLRDAVVYDDAAGVSIPLGMDKTEAIVLRNELVIGQKVNASYSIEFKSSDGGRLPVNLKNVDNSLLPPGLTYDGQYIKGIPTRAGEYRFYLGDQPYFIKVEPARLRFWADNLASYYGENELRGVKSADITFSYDKADIRSLDLAKAKPVTGKGTELAALLDEYTAPTFTAMADPFNPVTRTTRIGQYSIVYEDLPTSRNYEFDYIPEGKSGLTILARPFVVEKLTPAAPVGEIYSDMPGVLTGLTADLGGETAGFVAALPQSAGQAPGYYDGHLLTPQNYKDGVLLPGDAALKLTYRGDYVRLPRDGTGAGAIFTLNDPIEERNVAVSLLAPAAGSNPNYKLVGDGKPIRQEAGEVRGLVRRRDIESLEIRQVPSLAYQYGQRLDSPNALRFYVVKGSGDGETREGLYDYNEQKCRELGITVTWATEAELAALKPGQPIPGIPYQAGYGFQVKDSGRFLCMFAPSTDREGKPTIIVSRWETQPLSVTPRTLTLTAKEGKRYYGEANGDLANAFTYNVDDLAFADRKDGLKGEGAELAGILAAQHYTTPKLKAVVSEGNPEELTATTPSYAGVKQAVLIWGAACDNYVFRYARTGGTYSTQQGVSDYQILPRPIVLTKLKKTTDLATIYADTKQIFKKGLSLAITDVDLALPARRTATSNAYYPRYSKLNDPDRVDIGYGSETVLLPGDETELGISYTAHVAPTDGVNYVNYEGFAKGHYRMDDATDGEKLYPVQVSDLSLTGLKANNYTLVYETGSAALDGLPGKVEVRSNCVIPGVNNSGTYYTAGTGKVLLRPIQSIEIKALPKMSYNYGEAFEPEGDGRELTIAIQYDTTYENFSGNTTRETVKYAVDGYENGDMNQPISNFDRRLLSICWLPKGAGDAVDVSKTLKMRDYLTVTAHDGARLAVAGKRGKQELVKSAVTTQALSVSPKPLALTADDWERCYGEPNKADKDFAFTFKTADLAPPDQKKLEELGFTALKGATAQLQQLADAKGYTYQAPMGSTAAKQNDDVLDGGKGSYPITLQGGVLTNYVFRDADHVPGKLYIHQRPLKIKEFISSFPDNPIYTIYSNTTNRFFDTEVAKSRFTPDPVDYLHLANPERSLRVTGSSIYPGDEVDLKLNLWYSELGESVSLEGQSKIGHRVTVRSAALVPGTRAARNYVLQSGFNNQAWGAVELRGITDVVVENAPSKPLGSYIYGEALDLRGLKVKLTYKVLGSGESQLQEQHVDYVGPDQFKQYGLYVNYFDAPSTPNWTGVPATYPYPEAATGDHLTIAPTHDSVKKGTTFTANGKYLVVSAQRHTDQKLAAVLVSQTAIRVAPLPLQFTLAADDKVYDGDTKAAGTLAFRNAFRREGAVDRHHTSGVTDLVYPVTGAAYEKPSWGSLAGNDDFKTYLDEGGRGYSFATGPYREHTLTFSFLDPDVAYQQPPTHDSFGPLTAKPVKVEGITLAGPDRANYSIVPAVLPVGPAPAGYLGAKPTATIRKAQRPKLPMELLPKAELDVHTNVVRVYYPQSLSQVEGAAARDQDGLHFEYALRYVDKGVTRQWAGLDGSAQWWDERYFGGESALPALTDSGYLPRPEDLPRAEDLAKPDAVRKGQLYVWAGEDKGFTLDPTAYPGGAVWPGYYLYQINRAPLPRDTVFLPVVRAAETNNYYASPALSAVGEDDPALELEAALARAEAEQAYFLTLAETGRWPEVWPQAEPTPAVKTYKQRLDILSAAKKQSAGGERKEFSVETLEAVWFTDLLEYKSSRAMDAVLRNNKPTRYYSYAWDGDRSAPLRFEDRNPILLNVPFQVEIKRRKEDGKEETTEIWVNRDHIARIYADIIGTDDEVPVRAIEVLPHILLAAVGDAPQQLEVLFTPKYATDKKVKWESSNSAVATVDKNGLVTFMGPGMAVITATSRLGRTDRCIVLVAKSWAAHGPSSVFNLRYLEPFLTLENDLFRPGEGMTRGQAVALLAKFYIPNEGRAATEKGTFPDLTGEEPYAAAARLLGALGVVNGREDGAFDGEGPVTRAEFVTMLTRMLGLETPDTKGAPHAFLDTGETDTWAYPYIDAMSALGLLNGVGANYFAPNRPITRAETADLLTRLLAAGVDVTARKNLFPGDVEEDHWGYAAILRALRGAEIEPDL